MPVYKTSLPGTLFCVIVFCLMFPACARIGLLPDSAEQSNNSNFQDEFPVYNSYKDIHGITQEEINAVEKFRNSGRSFIYGTHLVSECFEDNGRMNGFAALLCQWLGSLFNLNFTPVIYEWTELQNGLETGAIDFTGELTSANEQLALIVEENIPPVCSSVSMVTRKAELVPIISIIQKYLDQGALHHLVDLYNQGYKDYTSYCFRASLTQEETDYIAVHNGSRGEVKPIPFIMEQDNYPWAFYNKNEKIWQGIAWDVLKEIESVSGLYFKIVSSENDTWLDNLAQLEYGEGTFISKLISTSEQKDRFLWSEIPYAKDQFALISKQETPDIKINGILYSKVGLLANSAYSEYFPLWFPNHSNTVTFQRREEALKALKNGEIDLYMGTRDTLLNLTNYLEEPGYKINQIFSLSADSYFGFNMNEKVLCSIINKAQLYVDTQLLENQWLSRSFDYRTGLIRTRQPYLIGFAVVLGVIVFLLISLLKRYQDSSRQLKTTIKRRIRELEIQKNMVQTAYKVKNRFLANMSHEIRTPLNAIIGFSQTELEKAASSESRENLSNINRSGSSLLGIINDLLDISNIESGQLRLKSRNYSLPLLINSAANSAKIRIGNKTIDFLFEADGNLPSKLYGDSHRINQIIGNLLSNAVKFTNEGSILFRIGSEKLEGDDDDKVMLIFEVCDTGIGIQSDHISKIFSDYDQADTGSNRLTGGIGMGLQISKKLAKLMGGNVNVISEYGKGSVFTAWIPQKIVDETAIGIETSEKLRTFSWKENQEEKFSLSYARVLVVDDVPTNLAVAKGIMRPYKMVVDTVSSGEEAFELIFKAKTHYDAIFMDHMMPGMDGIETTHLIRELKTDYAKNIPIIALTANVLPESEELFLANGFNAFIAKPIDTNVLNKILNEWVRNKEKEKFLTDKSLYEEEKLQSSILADINIEGVDLAAGAAQFGGEENYLEIVKVFVNDTPKLLKDVQNFIDELSATPSEEVTEIDSLKNYSITVHGIKGSCYGICAATVGDLAKELEMAAKAKNLEKVFEFNNPFIKSTEKLIEELRILFPKKEDETKPQKKAPDPALLEKLMDAARTYNYNKMTAILDELDEYQYQENGESIKQLRQATDDYEYSEVIKLLAAFLEAKSDGKILAKTTG